MTQTSPASEGNDIAIVGMAAHLPDAPDVEAFWQNLRAGRSSVRDFSLEQLRAAGVPEAELRKSQYVRAGIVLDGLAEFDAGFFGLSPKDAAIMDPQHRHFLECCWEALESAGHVPKRFPGAIGVFAGCGMGAYFMFNVCSNPSLVESVGMFLLRHTGNDKDFLATRVSYDLDLRGPSVNVQTACSTSLVAVHLACQSLLAGECDMALAGGVTILVPHGQGYVFHEGEVLSPDGRCRAFDERAKGTVFGSGAGVVCLRRLDDALRDGDRILAVVKGSAVNNDGKNKVGYLAPSVDGHAQAISEAIEIAGLAADDISYVETHGTGTAVGDPIEISAFTQAFRETSERNGFCRIGSVKTNIGHLDTAAGVASLIKVVQAMRHRELPPSLNYERPNPAIDFARTPFAVNTALTPWRSEGPRRAGVSSLGVGGTNAHVVLEEAPEQRSAPSRRAWQVFPLSARTENSLAGSGERLARHLETHGTEPLADVAWTLQTGRETFERRRSVVARDHAEAARMLREADPSTSASARCERDGRAVAFLLPGGGAQHPGMGRELYESEPVYRAAFDACLRALAPERANALRRLVLRPAPSDPAEYVRAADELERMPLQLPAIFAVSWSLAKLLESWGITPERLLGHSLGENTAAALAGVITLEDAVRLVELRGLLFEKTAPGAILSVELPRAQLEPRLPAGVGLAIENGPELCAVSGPTAAIDAFERELRAEGVEVTRIRVVTAAHSALLDPILPEFGAFLRSIRLSKPRVRFVSNLTGDWITDAQAVDPEYWVAHLRNTVRFAEGVTRFAADGHVLLEVGPGKALSSLARANGGAELAKRAFNAMRHRDEAVSDVAFALGVLGRLWCAGVNVDWKRLHEGEGRLKSFLPPYAFDRGRYWIEPGKPAAVESESGLTKIEDLANWFSEPEFVERPRPAANVAARRVLLLGDGEELCTALAERLAGEGREVALVRAGERFERVSAREYAVRPSEREDVDLLVADLAQGGFVPDLVVHAWTLTRSEATDVTTSFFHQMQERGFYALLFLAQAWTEHCGDAPLRLCVVTSGMAALDGEELPHPIKSAVLGPVRVIPRELPGADAKCIDVTFPGGSRLFGARRRKLEGLVTEIAAEIAVDAADLPERVVLLRAGKRFVETLVARPRAAAQTPAFVDGGVYVLTGGLGGIAVEIAAEIAAVARAPKLVLLGRSAMPPAARWNAWLAAHGTDDDSTTQRIHAVRRLEAAGAEVLVLAADVANLDESKAALDETRRRFGRIDGVIHAAGAIDDAVLQMKDPASVDGVFSPKVHGTLLLERLLADDDLAFLVLFSSTSSFLGLVGQVDYTAANAFLNAFARSRNRGARGGRRVVAVDWGIWRDVGMAARALGAAGTSAAERAGIAAGEIGEDAGHPLLGRLVLRGENELCFVAEWSTDELWVLDEHRLAGGEALLPGTGYLELARAAFAVLGRRGACVIEGATFLAPLGVAAGERRRVRVQLERADGRAAAWSYEVASRGAGERSWTVHATATVREREATAGAPATADLAALRARTTQAAAALTADGRVAAQAKFLAFGPRWQVLRELGRGANELRAELALGVEHAGDLAAYALHPALLDIATGVGLPLVPDYDEARQFYAPLSYGRVTIHRPLGERMTSRLSLRAAGSGLAHFDVALFDGDGRLLVEVEDFCVRRIEGTAALAARPNAPAGESARGDGDDGPLRVLIADGIRPAEGREALKRVLAHGSAAQVVVSSLPLEGLRRYAATRHAGAGDPVAGGAHFERPQLETNYVEPRDEIERTLSAMWRELLGVDRVGIEDDFFELGGYSLIAVRLFAKVKKAWKLEFPLSILFEAPTVERLARIVRAELGIELGGADEGAAESTAAAERPRFTHIVPMHVERAGTAKSERTPFFLCAGMFGNVMNLRHLAGHLGQEQPFYGLQALGVDGKSEPHETFEEMARAYLQEVRQVQPRGPYRVGGFSGGGIVAYEMARQLREAGEEVEALVLLDTWLPHEKLLSYADRREMHAQRFRSQGLKYAGGILWNRLLRNKKRLSQIVNGWLGRIRPYEFRESKVELAFRRALVAYDTPRWPGEVVLVRPKLDVAHVLSSGNRVNSRANYVWDDNGWSQYVDGAVRVVEVPGDHDSMVLEPQVRVLAARLREVFSASGERREAAAEPAPPLAAARAGRGADYSPSKL